MRQQPTFQRVDRSGAGGGRERPDGGGASMMVPLPPGWLCLQDCNLSGQLNQPVVVPFVLMHPDVGVALVDVAPASNPEAEAVLRRRLEAARFDSIFPGFLPVLHLRLDRADLPATEAILRDAFAATPPLSVPGGDGWVSVVRRALLPRDPSRAAAHSGLSGDHARRFRRDPAAAGPPPEPDRRPDMLHREAVTVRGGAAAGPSFEETESPVPAARPTGPLPWVIMAGVGGLIAALALFSLLETGPGGGPPPDAAGEAPSAAAPPAAGTPFAGGAPAPPDGASAFPKPPAAPAAPPPPLPRVAAPPPPPVAPNTAAGASAPPAPAQRPAPPAAAPAAADRLPRVTVRQPANLRTGPDGQANIVRVVPRGETLRVHGRTANGWVQVGDAEPRGWLHTSRLGDVE